MVFSNFYTSSQVFRALIQESRNHILGPHSTTHRRFQLLCIVSQENALATPLEVGSMGSQVEKICEDRREEKFKTEYETQ